MSESVLMIERRLAIKLLHEAQLSPQAPVRGLVGARDGVPCAIYPWAAAQTRAELEAKLQSRNEQLWAVYRSTPQTPGQAIDSDKDFAGHAFALVISLNTKGVLEMRCWDWRSGAAQERVIQVEQ